MVFSSRVFCFYFLPLAFGVYYLTPRSWRNCVLTLLSYVFYGWANPLFVFLLLGSTIIDYICGLIISGKRLWSDGDIPALNRGQPRSTWQKIALIVSICLNLTILGFFKYYNFGVDAYNGLALRLGFEGLDSTLNVILPLGISFYTFQTMSYSIDIYRGDARAVRKFTDFACYVGMFPQLVAGPIVRYKEIANQLQAPAYNWSNFARGVTFFCLGMAKKILLANPCGKIADTVFDAGSALALDAWQGMFAYSMQIYFDFSGYSDMAIGIGLMLGFVFSKNFDSPYVSKSITEFWRRWHISLSTWLRDNLYIPLGGNRKGMIRTYINLGIVMLLGGLWHGASWNFVVWGGFHGLMLTGERFIGKQSVYRYLPSPVRTGLTFILVSFAWVFFRTDDLPKAIAYFSMLFGIFPLQDGAELLRLVLHSPYYLFSMGVAALVTWTCPQAWDFTRRLDWKKGLLCLMLLMVALIMLETQNFNPFIYFIF